MSSFKQYELQRTMKSRHLFMIALGGVIGTGLFLGSGFTISQAGPLGSMLAYILGGFLMYLVMLCLGELAVIMPEPGSFQSYTTKYLGPSTGFMIGWLYWFGWANTVGLEFTSAGILMQRWFPDIPIWVWCLIFGSITLLVNVISARSFAETEFWFSSIKIAAVVLFIIIGLAATFGFIHFQGNEAAPFLSNFTTDHGLFPNGMTAVLLTLVMVSFSFQGTELVGIAAGESENPEKTIPNSIRNIVWRTLFFFVLAMFVLAAIIPYKTAGVTESPFVAVLDKIGIPYAADIMNFVILTAVLSVANSGLYAGARMLWSLSRSEMGPSRLSKLSKKGVPINALLITFAVASFSLITSFFSTDTVYLWLISIAGVGTIVSWMCICASHFFFRRRFINEGGDIKDLKFKAPLFPIVPILGFVLNGLVLISLFFIPDQKAGLYGGGIFIALCYLYYHFNIKKKRKIQENKSTIRKTNVR
ncbi:amino acid permease [Niallia sp. 01092]|uniref:amino acid permease n=1 Tax=unclassified Niallia TaxID=2837522 RepID=UPI003FD39A0F